MSRYRFLIEFAAAMLAYAVVLTLSIVAIAAQWLEPHWNVVLSLAPVLPAIAVAVVVLRQIRAADELQRRIQLEALSLAFAGTALITFSYGFLENVGFPRLSMFAVWPLMAVLWIIGGMVSARRFR